jgi:hypothetical protein
LEGVKQLASMKIASRRCDRFLVCLGHGSAGHTGPSHVRPWQPEGEPSCLLFQTQPRLNSQSSRSCLLRLTSSASANLCRSGASRCHVQLLLAVASRGSNMLRLLCNAGLQQLSRWSIELCRCAAELWSGEDGSLKSTDRGTLATADWVRLQDTSAGRTQCIQTWMQLGRQSPAAQAGHSGPREL